MSGASSRQKRSENSSGGQPIHDDRLPELHLALDPEAMTREFRTLFERDHPGAFDVTSCEILRAYHKPGRSCRVVYRVRGRDAAGSSFEHVFWAQFSSDPARAAKQAARAPDTWPGCAPFRPLRPCPSLQASMHAFPHDPKLAHLGRLADPAFVVDRVNEHMRSFGLGPGWTCRRADVHIVKYMPGARCVLRYDIGLSGPEGERRSETFYGKTYKNATSRYVHAALRAIHASLRDDEPDLVVPAPIAHLDAHHTLWQAAWEGEPLHARGARLGWPSVLTDGDGERLARIGRSLARLHAVPPPAVLKPGEPPEKVLGNAAGDAADILDFAPERRETLERILATLRTAAPAPCAPARRTLVHGTFKIAQVLCRGDEVAIVDFDSVALGDPLYDVAEFAASLAFLRVKDGVPAEATTRGVASFIAAYETAARRTCDRRRIAWYVVAFLLGKIHSSLKKHAAGGTDTVLPALSILAEWLAHARGERNDPAFENSLGRIATP